MHDWSNVLRYLGEKKIGLLGGAGNIGRVFAEKWVENGFPKEKLILSYRGSPATTAKLEASGLVEQSTTDNQRLLDESKVIIVCLRAQEIPSLKSLAFSRDVLFACMSAGVSCAALKSVTGVNTVHKALACGHDLISNGTGIVALYPENQQILAELYRNAGSTLLSSLPSEPLTNLFFALLPTPAAIVVCEKLGVSHSLQDVSEFVQANSPEPMECANDMYGWARTNSDSLLWKDSLGDFESYIDSMCTKGGLTEAVTQCIMKGGTFKEGLQASFDLCIKLVQANDAQIGV